MTMQFEWLIKFFTYSSIQVKIVASIMAFIIFFIFRKIIQKYAVNKIKDVKIRYRWQKILSYTSFTLSAIIVGQIWFKGIQSIATYLGLVSAGIAVALKDPLVNLIGWQYILWRRPFDVGDRVEIGQKSGDVIDITAFNFTMMEIGNRVNADESTGRIIHVPNGRVFTDDLANYGKGFKYIWNEIKVLVTFESNWKKAKKILKTIANDHSEYVTTEAAREYEKATQLFMIQKPNFKPEVYTKVEDSGVNLTIRYLCNPRKRRLTAQIIWEEVLNEFDKHNDIGFAYPTIRYYDER